MSVFEASVANELNWEFVYLSLYGDAMEAMLFDIIGRNRHSLTMLERDKNTC